MNEIKIHGIKALTEIPDYSLYLYMFLWIISIIVFFIAIFLIYKYFSNRNKTSRKKYFDKLKNVDLENSKKAAYEITRYSRILARSNREKKLSNELIEELHAYKYKKTVEPLNDNIKILYGRLMDNIDV